ncbi:MAG: S1C family serine protease [Cytophagaceae bacterium]
MKQFLTLLAAAVIGSLIAIAALKWTDRNNNDSLVKYNDTPSSVQNAPAEFGKASSKALPAVVHIHSAIGGSSSASPGGSGDPYKDFWDQFERRRPRENQMATGSGVIINANGYIVTNDHVIDGANEIRVTLNDNRVYTAKKIGTDPSTDIALIKIDEKNLPSVEFGNSDNAHIGDWVLAVGNPFNLSSTVTAGIISAKARNIQILKDRSAIEAFLQTDAAVNPGNSGGALVNLEGQLIGITTAIATPTGAFAGYSFAVPSNIVAKVITDLEKFGEVKRAYLGVVVRDLDPNVAAKAGLKEIKGALVENVVSSSAADKAGIKPGDVILSINGNEVYTSTRLLEIIATHYPGDKVSLEIIRNGKPLTVHVELFDKPGAR